jgi:hypothetical protein
MSVNAWGGTNARFCRGHRDRRFDCCCWVLERGKRRARSAGNPGGKPKELKEIQLEARKMSFDALKTLETVCKNSKSPAAARVAAANAILDRAYGKPPQFFTGDADQFRTATEMSDEELLAIVAGGNGGVAKKAEGGGCFAQVLCRHTGHLRCERAIDA